MAGVVSDVGEITPCWLTGVLQRKGYLHDGQVATVETIRSQKTSVSTIYHLQVNYTITKPDALTRLFLKIPSPAMDWTAREVEFYRDLLPLMQQQPAACAAHLPTCYDAAHDKESNCTHLLLADLSRTHFVNAAQMPPNPHLCKAVIYAFAHFHAFWWQHPRLGQDIGALLSGSDIDDSIALAQRKYTNFVEFSPAQTVVAAQQRTTLQQVVGAWPARRRQRVVHGQGVTLVHRDPHPRNFLFPHDPNLDTVKLIDWQSWRIDTGTDDLAYLMACHWPLEPASRVEWDLVQRYHQMLVRHGVSGYSWDDCWYDYRASILRCLFFLLVAWSPRQWKNGVWWTRVQRGLAAYERWDCEELMEKETGARPDTR